jgi:hypothetical protein
MSIGITVRGEAKTENIPEKLCLANLCYFLRRNGLRAAPTADG